MHREGLAVVLLGEGAVLAALRRRHDVHVVAAGRRGPAPRRSAKLAAPFTSGEKVSAPIRIAQRLPR